MSIENQPMIVESNEEGSEAFGDRWNNFVGEENGLRERLGRNARVIAALGAISTLSACAGAHVEFSAHVHSQGYGTSSLPYSEQNYPGPMNRSGRGVSVGATGTLSSQPFRMGVRGSPFGHSNVTIIQNGQIHSENTEAGVSNVQLAQFEGATLGAQVEIDGVTHTFEVPFVPGEGAAA